MMKAEENTNKETKRKRTTDIKTNRQVDKGT